MSLWDGIDDSQAARIRKELQKEIRRELSTEMRADIERKVREDVRRKARDELLAEQRSRAPSEDDRRAFVAFVEEVELDSYAQATMASRIADESDQALTSRSGWATPLGIVLTLAAPGLVAALAHAGLDATWFWAAVSTLILVLGLVLISTSRHQRQHRDALERHRKISSDFLILAERAKAYRMVHAERLQEAETLHELLEELRRAKERQDRTFHPSAPALEAARDYVRYRVETTLEPDEEDEVEAETASVSR